VDLPVGADDKRQAIGSHREAVAVYDDWAFVDRPDDAGHKIPPITVAQCAVPRRVPESKPNAIAARAATGPRP
jgi:hypothetical protein